MKEWCKAQVEVGSRVASSMMGSVTTRAVRQVVAPELDHSLGGGSYSDDAFRVARQHSKDPQKETLQRKRTHELN